MQTTATVGGQQRHLKDKSGAHKAVKARNKDCLRLEVRARDFRRRKLFVLAEKEHAHTIFESLKLYVEVLRSKCSYAHSGSCFIWKSDLQLIRQPFIRSVSD